MKWKKPAAATNWAHWETEMHSKYCSNIYEANMQMCKRDGKPRKRSKKSKMQTRTKIEGRESVYSVCKNGRESIGWEWREWQERESDTILTNRQIYALGLIWMGGERGSTHTALQIQIQMHACVRLFIGICPKDTTYTKLHQHIAVSNILLSIHSTYYLFCLGTQTPIILVVRQCFFFQLRKKIDSLNIYLTAHSLYSECLPASDGFYVYSMFFLPVGVKWFHSLHSFIQNIKHLIVELTRYDAKCVTNMCSRSTYTVGGGGGGEPNSKHIKKRKPNNNYFHFCGNKLCVRFTQTLGPSNRIWHRHCTAQQRWRQRQQQRGQVPRMNQFKTHCTLG